LFKPVGCRTFPVAAARVWNELETSRHVCTIPASLLHAVVWRLLTFFAVPFWTFCSACEVTRVIVGLCSLLFFTYLLTYLLTYLPVGKLVYFGLFRVLWMRTVQSWSKRRK